MPEPSFPWSVAGSALLVLLCTAAWADQQPNQICEDACGKIGGDAAFHLGSCYCVLSNNPEGAEQRRVEEVEFQCEERGVPFTPVVVGLSQGTREERCLLGLASALRARARAAKARSVTRDRASAASAASAASSAQQLQRSDAQQAFPPCRHQHECYDCGCPGAVSEAQVGAAAPVTGLTNGGMASQQVYSLTATTDRSLPNAADRSAGAAAGVSSSGFVGQISPPSMYDPEAPGFMAFSRAGDGAGASPVRAPLKLRERLRQLDAAAVGASPPALLGARPRAPRPDPLAKEVADCVRLKLRERANQRDSPDPVVGAPKPNRDNSPARAAAGQQPPRPSVIVSPAQSSRPAHPAPDSTNSELRSAQPSSSSQTFIRHSVIVSPINARARSGSNEATPSSSTDHAPSDPVVRAPPLFASDAASAGMNAALPLPPNFFAAPTGMQNNHEIIVGLPYARNLNTVPQERIEFLLPQNSAINPPIYRWARDSSGDPTVPATAANTDASGRGILTDATQSALQTVGHATATAVDSVSGVASDASELAHQAAEKVKGAASSTVHGAAEIAEGAWHHTEQAAHTGADTLYKGAAGAAHMGSSALHKVGEVAEGAWNTTQDVVSAGVSAIEAGASKVAQGAGNLVHGAWNRTEHIAGAGLDAVQDGASSAGQMGSSALHKVGDLAHGAVNKTHDAASAGASVIESGASKIVHTIGGIAEGAGKLLHEAWEKTGEALGVSGNGEARASFDQDTVGYGRPMMESNIYGQQMHMTPSLSAYGHEFAQGGMPSQAHAFNYGPGGNTRVIHVMTPEGRAADQENLQRIDGNVDASQPRENPGISEEMNLGIGAPNNGQQSAQRSVTVINTQPVGYGMDPGMNRGMYMTHPYYSGPQVVHGIPGVPGQQFVQRAVNMAQQAGRSGMEGINSGVNQGLYLVGSAPQEYPAGFNAAGQAYRSNVESFSPEAAHGMNARQYGGGLQFPYMAMNMANDVARSSASALNSGKDIVTGSAQDLMSKAQSGVEVLNNKTKAVSEVAENAMSKAESVAKSGVEAINTGATKIVSSANATVQKMEDVMSSVKDKAVSGAESVRAQIANTFGTGMRSAMDIVKPLSDTRTTLSNPGNIAGGLARSVLRYALNGDGRMGNQYPPTMMYPPPQGVYAPNGNFYGQYGYPANPYGNMAAPGYAANRWAPGGPAYMPGQNGAPMTQEEQMIFQVQHQPPVDASNIPVVV